MAHPFDLTRASTQKPGAAGLGSATAGTFGYGTASTNDTNPYRTYGDSSGKSLFRLDAEETKAYELKPSAKPSHTLHSKPPTNGHAQAGRKGSASAAAPGHQQHTSHRVATAGTVKSTSGSSTLRLVKSAFGLNEESKMKELNDIATTISAANVHVARARRMSVGHIPTAEDQEPLPPTDPNAVHFSGDPVADVEVLRTGEDAIAYFLRYGPGCPIKFVTCVRQYPDHGDIFRPYDLRVVKPEDIKEDTSHFTLSGNGVVFISPGQPSEFLTLAEWMRDASAFNICRSMRFFAQFLTRKTYLRWSANVRFNKYMKQHRSIKNTLFIWKPSFTAAASDIGSHLAAMERINILEIGGSRYTFGSFQEAQSVARAEALRAFERHLSAIQTAIERVAADVFRRAHVKEDEEEEEREALKNKSMAAAKEAAARKAAALREAQAEEAILGAFVRKTDYMIVETLVRVILTSFQHMLSELNESEHRKNGVPGLFHIAVAFHANGTGFDPSLEEMIALVDSTAMESIKTVNSVPRLLYARGFREYVQGLHTEEGAGVFGAPAPSDILNHSPTWREIRAGIESKFRTDFGAASSYTTAFDGVRPVWQYSQDFDFAVYRASEPNTFQLQKDMSKLKALEQQIEKMRTQHVEGSLFIDSKRLKLELEPITTQGIERLKGLLMDMARVRCKTAVEQYLARAKILDSRPSTLEKFAAHVERLLGVRDAEPALVKESSSVEDMYKLLTFYEVKVASDDAVALDDMRNAGLAYTDCYRKSEAWLEECLPEMSRQLDMNILKVNDALKLLADSAGEGQFIDPATPSAVALQALSELLEKLASLEAQTATYTKWQMLFNTPPFEWHRLRTCRKAVETRMTIWGGLNAYENHYQAWTTQPFIGVDVEELAREVQSSYKSAYSLDKQLGDPVAALWKGKVAEFKPAVATVVELGNKSMRDRHWKRVYEDCGASFAEGRAQERTLSELMGMGVLGKGELVSEMSGVASGEAQLEASLEKIVHAWANTDFLTKNYREQKGVYILGGLEEIMTQLEDHAVTLQTMMGSRFIQGVREQVEQWEKKLSLLADTLDEWLSCQKQWMYLETIFSAEDIQRQLPAEAANFAQVDRSWKDIMAKTHAHPNAISCLAGGNALLNTFLANNESLEQIQKSLEDYLETKRAGFPRFYFLSNDELLAILSQTRDPQAVQPHLQKCFDAIKSLNMAEDGDHVVQISGMVSSEGEKVPFTTTRQAKGDVTEWLTHVEAEMRKCLYDHSKSALQRYPSWEAAVERKDWYFTGPAQSIIVVDQIMWTQGCGKALKDIASGKDKEAMTKFLEYSRKQLDNMVALVRQELTKLQRTLLGALTVIDVHARDVVTAMIAKKTGSIDEFEWTKQLRYYWETEVDNCVVRQTNTRFIYGYEYLGNCDRLVITPLTDQCYMTLTGALHLKFGGAPAGPAGTGKTETTKDLAKALANQCVVFNCSDGLDYMIMGRFFSGLAQAGAWACFDEFNRIDIEVLSVIAQQVLVIQQGLMSKASHIVFEGREIPLNQSFGVFITMNPGYAGRSELPDNLKSLFRPVAMMVPDYRLIAEIVLFSQGFADAVKLSYKMVQLYRLSSEQLSKQDHYDFGMRAVKSVLVAAGQLKRKEPEVDENILLIRAMRDSNVPKFLAQDLPLFYGILTDLFPGVDVPRVDRGRLLTAIEDQMDIAGLQRVPTLITKIIETHETQLVRHGMMLVGESGSGKTANYMTLARALGQLKREGVHDKDGFFQVVNCYVLNPKSITMGELYGEFNLATQEWRDGLVAALVRQAVQDTGPNRKWVMFDGPVDAIWIENMNTVLDDNKMLCLSNGERIKLPLTMHMMFEVRDLAVASPATVSRCGMVYMEPIHVGTEALIQTWAQGEIEDLLPSHAKALCERILTDVPRVLKFVRGSCSEVIASQDGNLVSSFVNLLLTLLKPENGVKAAGGNPYPRCAADKAKERYYATHGGQEGDGEGAEGKEEEKKEDSPAPAPAPAPAAAAPAAAPADATADLEGEEDGTGAKKAKSGVMEPDHLEKVINLSYVFALVWSFGANLHDSSRAKFNAFVHDLLGEYIPTDMKAEGDSKAAADLYSYYVDVEPAAFKDWTARMPSFTYSAGMPYFSILVPSIDTTRYSYLFNTIISSGRNVLFSGETGVGKSVIIADALSKMCIGDFAQFTAANVNFSAQTTSGNLQEALEANLDKKRKNLLGPPAGKRMVVFVDDLNMPAKEKYGAQPPIELLRQVIDQGGFYDRQKLFFKQVASTLFAAGCAPPGGGRSETTTRVTRRFHLVWLPTLSVSSMSTIFTAILGGFLSLEAPELTSVVPEVVAASVDVYQRVQQELLPTPAKSHYTFNLRDISKVFQGVLMARGKALADKDSLLRLWLHEEQRVFRDRLISAEDRSWFNGMCGELLQARMGVSWPVESFEGLLYGDYTSTRGAADRPYVQIQDVGRLSTLFTEYQDEFNLEGKAMNLVFFKDAVAHVSRISRILRQPRGNAMLVGVGGSGRQSLTRLAAFMAEYRCNSIEITRGYGVNEFHEDLKKMLMLSGIKQQDIVFLFSDTQIVKESFLEDINNILNSGDVPNLYAPDEMEQIINGCRAATKAAGKLETRANIFGHYIATVRERLHIVLCMSPIGDAFRNRCRMFPSLVNCTTIDWFNAWPDDALYSVAKALLGGEGNKLDLGELVDPLCSMCVKVHQSVQDASARYLAEQRRYNYTTPTSYLELLRLYTGMLNGQRDIVQRKISRYRGGLTKLAETNDMVAGLQAKLKDLQPVLEKAAADTAALLVQLERDQKDADEQAALAAKDEAETALVAKNVSVIKDDCQKDLDEALPAYYNAVKALNSLDKKQIQEVKSFANPPKLVGFVLEAVCILVGQKETWDDAKKLMNQANFMDQLKQYDKDNIDPKVIKKVTKYIKDPEFTPDVVSKVSQAATSLCLWVRAIYKYNEVAQTIAPKKAKLAEAEGQLEAAMTTLEAKRAQLAAVQARVAELKASFQASLNKRDELDRQSKQTVARLERAEKLTGGLGAEASRWQSAANQLENDMTNLVGNMLLASGCIAYVGAFTSQYRAGLVSSWVKAAMGLYIPVDARFSLTRLLADPVQVREWNIMGLPADDFSTENGLFASMGRRWPLMIDPQGQANRWIKNLHKNDKLEVIKLSQGDFLRTLENAIRFGKPVLLENVEEQLDPSLEPVLLKQTFKKGGQVLLRLGDTDVPYSDEFKFYITTKLANPHYLPEVCIKVTIINFTVTLRGLEDQLLVDVVRQERPDLEHKKDQLVISIASDNKALKDIEDKILQMLAESTGDILDDEALINSLAQSKVTSNAIADRMKEAEVTTREITDARELYRPVATRGSILYFVIAAMALCDSMYQFSLPAFSRLYNLRIEKSQKSEVLQERLSILIDDVTRAFFSNICRGLFEQHKLLYAFMIAADIMKQAGTVSAAEWSMFLVGGTVKETGGKDVPPAIAAWMPAKVWLNLLAMEAIPALHGISDAIARDEGGLWSAFMRSTTAPTDRLPGRWGNVVGGAGTAAPHTAPVVGESLSTFQRLIITRMLREEKCVIATREFVRAQLGPFFCEPPPFDLEGAYGDSSAQTPLIFILSPGADPIDYLLKLAKAKGKSGPGFKIISLGQGQGPIAEAMMNAARASGDWVCLQNCHLSVSWLPKLEALLEKLTGTGEHPDYRLWLTSLPSPAFPVAILQNGVKITQEPPKGIRANLMRTFLDMSEKDYDGSKRPGEFKKLLFGLAFYHALVLERRKFGPLGWNIPYDFMASDMKTASMQLAMYLDESGAGIVPYETLNNVVGDITYGGRVTDKWDKRTNLSLLSRYFTPEILLGVTGASAAKMPYPFAETDIYFAPEAGTLPEVRKYIESLPLDETPDVFGLHENASITLQLKETGELLATLVGMQPRSGGGGGGGGKSTDELVLEQVDAIMSRMGKSLNKADAHASTFVEDDAGNVNSLGVFLEQEMVRFNRLSKIIRSTLEQLKKAVRGLVVMSASLENMYNCFQFARVPPEWENAAYPSLKPLGYWVENFFQRLQTLHAWLVGGPPAAYWVSGFFFPQGFMTGALQMYARKTRIAIDALEFKTIVMPFGSESIPEGKGPSHGVYIYGLYLAGARWDVGTMKLAEMTPGQLLSPMPCVWLEPALNKDISTAGMYACPFYKTSRRAGTLSTTGHSTNFVTTVFLPSDKSQDHWVRRGTAALSEDENNA